jgi:hypothetical protein
VLISRDGDQLIGLMMTTVDHDREMANEASVGRHWYNLGPGPWDSKGRPSEVRLDRFLVVDPADVRREGSVLDEPRFNALVAALGPHLP